MRPSPSAASSSSSLPRPPVPPATRCARARWSWAGIRACASRATAGTGRTGAGPAGRPSTCRRTVALGVSDTPAAQTGFAAHAFIWTSTVVNAGRRCSICAVRSAVGNPPPLARAAYPPWPPSPARRTARPPDVRAGRRGAVSGDAVVLVEGVADAAQRLDGGRVPKASRRTVVTSVSSSAMPWRPGSCGGKVSVTVDPLLCR
jgi:hypothetical protein